MLGAGARASTVASQSAADALRCRWCSHMPQSMLGHGLTAWWITAIKFEGARPWHHGACPNIPEHSAACYPVAPGVMGDMLVAPLPAALLTSCLMLRLALLCLPLAAAWTSAQARPVRRPVRTPDWGTSGAPSLRDLPPLLPSEAAGGPCSAESESASDVTHVPIPIWTTIWWRLAWTSAYMGPR